MYRDDGDPYTDTSAVDDPVCGCAHPVSRHDGPAGECNGSVLDMDPRYGFEPGRYCYDPRHGTPCPMPCDTCVDEGCRPNACACTRYEGSV